MADNLLLPVCLDRITDANGVPYNGAKVNVYDAGTTDFKNVYTNATLVTPAANPIVADAGGHIAARYIGTGSYKLVVTTSANVEIYTSDNLPGALDTSPFEASAAKPVTPTIATAISRVISVAELGSVVIADPTGGNVTITLPDADDAGDGKRLTVIHDGTANSVIVEEAATLATLTRNLQAVTLISDAVEWRVQGRSDPDPALPRGYLAGLTLTRDVGDTDHDINIAVGECRDTGHNTNFRLTAAHIKRIDAVWASGTGNGGLASSLTAPANSTWYHVFLVDDGAGGVEAGFDTSVVAANLLADTGGSLYRRIGSIQTDGSANVLSFVQSGDRFVWPTHREINVSNPGTSALSHTLATPLGVAVDADLHFGVLLTGAVGTMYGLCTPLDVTDETPSSALSHLQQTDDSTGGVALSQVAMRVRTNTSSQVRTRVSASNADVATQIRLRGWFDQRGRDG